MKMTLKAARTNAGLSQSETAAALGITPQTLSRWERGETSPTIWQAETLCTIYGVEFEEIEYPDPFVLKEEKDND